LVAALIWIKSRIGNSANGSSMTTSRRPAIRHCPICRIAMQGAKSRDDLTDFDIFRCLTCETTIRESKSPSNPGGRAPDE